MLNKTIYIELENVLCNYNGRIFELRAENDCDDIEQLPIHYKDMKPIDGAIEAVEELAQNLDVYIVTPDEKREEKTEWVRTHLPQILPQRRMATWRPVHSLRMMTRRHSHATW